MSTVDEWGMVQLIKNRLSIPGLHSRVRHVPARPGWKTSVKNLPSPANLLPKGKDDLRFETGMFVNVWGS